MHAYISLVHLLPWRDIGRRVTQRLLVQKRIHFLDSSGAEEEK